MSSVHGLVDHLFRREAGRMVAALTRTFGPARIDLAEEVVQEALIQAIRRWPFHGVPENPSAWLCRVARNLALDRVRRDATFRGKEREIRDTLAAREAAAEDPMSAHGITDDQLRLIFVCCHPDLPPDGRVALTLKAVMGFGVREIARAFLARDATVAQRLVRAQRAIRDKRIPFDLPEPDRLADRIDGVLEVLYLVFNEGYTAHEGAELVRAQLCAEALRMATTLTDLPGIDRPSAQALAALLCLQASRLPARLDSEGNLMVLAEQDRSLWDRALIMRGFVHLDRASTGERLTVYHVQAAIAAHHAAATSDEATDWVSILGLYDQLERLNPSPVVALNRAVALSRVRGPAAGLDALTEIERHASLAGYYLLPAIQADLHRKAGSPKSAAECYRRALALPCSEPEQRFMRGRLAECGG